MCRAIPSPAATPEDGDVVVAVSAAQLRRSDLDSRGAVPGVAAFGTVIAAGEQALGLLGKRVLVGAFDPCGECDVCRRGSAAACPNAQHRGAATRGTLAERVTAQARWTVPLSDDMQLDGPALAAVAGDAAVAYTLYARSNIASRDPVILVGTSPITRFLVEILLAKGVTPVVVADPAASTWTSWLLSKQAVVCRAAKLTNVVGDDVRRQVAAALLASAPEGSAARAWRVIATSTDAVAAALSLATGPGAQLTVWAPSDEQAELTTQSERAAAQLAAAWMQEASIIAVNNAHPDLIVEVAAMAAKGELDLAGGCNVVGIDRVMSLDAEDPTRSLVVTVPALT
jgi:threonine dehydrogenase-like Zn-dependent dehydrogenase